MYCVASNSDLLLLLLLLLEGIDRSARDPVLVQDTSYMVEKTYHIAPYLEHFWGLFNASVTHIGFKMSFHIPPCAICAILCTTLPQHSVYKHSL